MNSNAGNNKSPLKKLLADKVARKEYTEQLLAAILAPFVEIDEEKGELYFKPNFYELSARQQVIILLCGRLAQKLLGFGDTEGFTQAEIAGVLKHVPKGTIKSSLYGLRQAEYARAVEGINIIDERQLKKIKEEFLGSSDVKT